MADASVPPLQAAQLERMRNDRSTRQLPAVRPVVALVRLDGQFVFPYCSIRTVKDFDCSGKDESPVENIIPAHLRGMPDAVMRAYIDHWLPPGQAFGIGLRALPTSDGRPPGYGGSAAVFVLEPGLSAENANHNARTRGIPMFFLEERFIARGLSLPTLGPRLRMTEAVQNHLAGTRNALAMGCWFATRNRRLHEETRLLQLLHEDVGSFWDTLRIELPTGELGWQSIWKAQRLITTLERQALYTYRPPDGELYHVAHAVVAGNVDINRERGFEV